MKDTWVIVISSAAVGALVSSALSLLSDLLERQARKRELIFNASIELMKEWMFRTIKFEPGKVFPTEDVIPEFLNVIAFHKILFDIFERGSLSDKTWGYLDHVMKDIQSQSAKSQPRDEGSADKP